MLRPFPGRRGFIAASLALGTARAEGPAMPWADAFVESVGVNVHLSSPPYRDAFAAVAATLAALGIRHLRDELRPDNDLARWRALYAQGVRSHMLVSPATNTVAEMLAYLQALGVQRVSAIEGQNEGDSPWFTAHPAARGDWARTVIAYQREVFRALRTRYGTALPVVSPTVLDYRPGDMRLLQPAAASCDVVAVHAYPQGRQEPETQDDYAGLGWYRRAFADPFAPGLPVMATEAGYHTATGGVPESVQAIYTPRLLLHAFAQGFRRTFLYELMDGGADPADPEHRYGLVRVDGAPKPVFHALRLLLGALGDRGAAPDRHPAAVAGVEGPADLRVMQFARRDGGTVVALWRAARSWDPVLRRDIRVDPAPAVLRLARPVRRAATLRLRAGQDWADRPAEPDRVAVPVDDTVTLLQLHA